MSVVTSRKDLGSSINVIVMLHRHPMYCVRHSNRNFKGGLSFFRRNPQILRC
ncbi:Uncharacterized protein APZ42_006915 [Daphnia magna]|uniref:Uncharacterized protein n=1 Tax=Daphnia magna TaxID=35525 RepID=A0A164FMG0_9CRUS|nr:Uncharacterized protein APZ42_006915 [Daphnia magna]